MYAQEFEGFQGEGSESKSGREGAESSRSRAAAAKKQRMVWTIELHKRFLNAVNHLVDHFCCMMFLSMHSIMVNESSLHVCKPLNFIPNELLVWCRIDFAIIGLLVACFKASKVWDIALHHRPYSQRKPLQA